MLFFFDFSGLNFWNALPMIYFTTVWKQFFFTQNTFENVRFWNIEPEV